MIAYNARMKFARKGWMLATLTILATGLPAATWEAGPASKSVSASEGGVVMSRAAVWRAIFARPPQMQHDDAAKAALGYDLFRDVRLSGSGKASCASCHHPARAFRDGRRTAVGPGGKVLARNVPALYDLAWATSFFWDGRAASLSAQARVPIEAPDELAGDLPAIAERLHADPSMRARFAGLYPDQQKVTADAVLDALAAYELSLTSPESRFDRWVAGDDSALGSRELAGFDIFVGKGGCVSCHGGWRLTDDGFHDVGVDSSDRGRGALDASGRPGLPEFKTPSLREVAHTAPYMHDGSLPSLEDVVDHYAGGFVRRPSLSPTLVGDLRLTGAEKADLLAFLRSLSSESELPHRAETTRPMPKK
jgi:cytochrome c peroxidase